MELKDIKELIKIIDLSGITEFEYQKDNIKILIKKNNSVKYVKCDEETKEESIDLSYEDKKEIKSVDEDLYIIKSPIVGTFYNAPNPTAKPYVSVGNYIKKGDVVCIIEAMKVMNEITSDVEGEVVKIMADNGSFVEYGQPLFGIRKV